LTLLKQWRLPAALLVGITGSTGWDEAYRFLRQFNQPSNLPAIPLECRTPISQSRSRELSSLARLD
jgi:hypothetical protein